MIDYLYYGFKKFGPHSEFIGCPSCTNLFVVAHSPSFNLTNLEKYFKSIKMQDVRIKCVKFDEDVLSKDLIKDDESLIEARKF